MCCDPWKFKPLRKSTAFLSSMLGPVKNCQRKMRSKEGVVYSRSAFWILPYLCKIKCNTLIQPQLHKRILTPTTSLENNSKTMTLERWRWTILWLDSYRSEAGTADHWGLSGQHISAGTLRTTFLCTARVHRASSASLERDLVIESLWPAVSPLPSPARELRLSQTQDKYTEIVTTSSSGLLFRKSKRKSSPRATGFAICACYFKICLHNATSCWVSQDNEQLIILKIYLSIQRQTCLETCICIVSKTWFSEVLFNRVIHRWSIKKPQVRNPYCPSLKNKSLQPLARQQIGTYSASFCRLART